VTKKNERGKGNKGIRVNLREVAAEEHAQSVEHGITVLLRGAISAHLIVLRKLSTSRGVR
jgi:hypothetical protein